MIGKSMYDMSVEICGLAGRKSEGTPKGLASRALDSRQFGHANTMREALSVAVWPASVTAGSTTAVSVKERAYRATLSTLMRRMRAPFKFSKFDAANYSKPDHGFAYNHCSFASKYEDHSSLGYLGMNHCLRHGSGYKTIQHFGLTTTTKPHIPVDFFPRLW